MAEPKDIVCIAAQRTPLGKFGGSLSKLRSFEIAASAFCGALESTGLDPACVDEVIAGSCRQAGNGSNPARTAALLAGVPSTVPATTINMACPSGMKCLFLAADRIASGEVEVVLTGGFDSMSTIPHYVRDLRFGGTRFGDITIEDGWKDATDPLSGLSMGQIADRIARKRGIGRSEQDNIAQRSQRLAATALRENTFGPEITQTVGRDGAAFETDETPRPGTSAEGLASLRPVFERDGTITAGNSCAMADGAAALILTTREKAGQLGAKPLFSILSRAEVAVENEKMVDGPAVSIPKALEKAGLQLADVDILEINEAFAAQFLANERDLGWDRDRVNVSGGAVALGHPTGCTGARIVVTLAHALPRLDKELGVASLCGAGGVSTAIVIRRER